MSGDHNMYQKPTSVFDEERRNEYLASVCQLNNIVEMYNVLGGHMPIEEAIANICAQLNYIRDELIHAESLGEQE